MAPNTDTLTAEPNTAAPETPSPPRARRGTATWVAVIAACVAVVAFALVTFVGGGDDRDIPTTRLDPQAEQEERQAHLDGQAITHGADRGAVTPGGAAIDYAGWAEAERDERQAHLEGQAITHGRRPVDAPE